MRKTLLSLIALCCLSTANAQTFRFGPTISGNLNLSDGMKGKVGFAVGAKVEMNFNEQGDNWFVDASVLFNNRNMKSESYYNNGTKDRQYWKYSTYSLLIPVNVGYKFHVSRNLNLLAAVGPYIDFGITGTDKAFVTNEVGRTTETKVSSNVYKDDLLNRISAGANANIGVEIAKHYQVNLSYNRGFTNMLKGGSDKKDQNISIGFAYMF